VRASASARPNALRGVNRGTILSLGVRVGDGYARLHDAMMRGLHVSRIELDEAWSFIAKKQRHLKPTDVADYGDAYVFLALAGAGKAIILWRVRKRNGENCRAFLADLRARVLGAPEISSDAFPAYPDAVERAFGIECTFGRIEKHYAVHAAVETARRYSPAAVISVSRRQSIGYPEKLSTSYVERQNLTLRMQQRRSRRLTNAFSKKVREPRRGCCAICRTLQFLPGSRNSAGHAPDATRHDRSHLDDWRVFRGGTRRCVTGPGGRRYGRFTVIDGGRE
jgi:hypothetical protein